MAFGLKTKQWLTVAPLHRFQIQFFKQMAGAVWIIFLFTSSIYLLVDFKFRPISTQAQKYN